MSGVRVPGLNRRVRSAIYDHIFANDDHEVGGVLVGRLGEGPLPNVTGAIAALEADGQRASVTFTHDAWASIHECLERDYPDQSIVGWYHSHPGFGIFLSRYDRFIHDNFFSDERQIAYVVDPHAGTEGVFSWQDGKLELLSEGPSTRPGTGGVSTRPATPRRKLPLPNSRAEALKYGLAVAVVASLLVVALVLVSSGASSTKTRAGTSNRVARLGHKAKSPRHFTPTLAPTWSTRTSSLATTTIARSTIARTVTTPVSATGSTPTAPVTTPSTTPSTAPGSGGVTP